jgi:hypothetical protein
MASTDFIDFDFMVGDEHTPKLHRFEPEVKEPNIALDTGDQVGACYLCNRITNVMIIFSPYPRWKQTDPEVKPYKIRMCPWCAIGHKIIPKPDT